MPCRTTGKAASRPLPPSTQDHPEALAGQAAAVQRGEEALPFDGAPAAGAPEVDDLLPAVVADAERHQDRPPERAVGQQRLAVILQRPAVEGVDRPVEGPGDPAHRRGRDRAPGQGKQDLADLAGREPRNEAGQDRTVDLRRASRVALRNPGRAEVPGTRHVAFDVAGVEGVAPAVRLPASPSPPRTPVAGSRSLQPAVASGGSCLWLLCFTTGRTPLPPDT